MLGESFVLLENGGTRRNLNCGGLGLGFNGMAEVFQWRTERSQKMGLI